MTRKTLMAIHTFHSDEAKQEFFGGMPESETTDREWAEGWSFEKPSCVATWAGKDDFFFAIGKLKAKRILFPRSPKKAWMNSSSLLYIQR